MERGRKKEPREVHAARGTVQPCRAATGAEQPSASDEVAPPADIPGHALLLWHDHVTPLIELGRFRAEDVPLLAQWCVMYANIIQSWQPDQVPAPASYVSEWRKICELLGFAGQKSRIGSKPAPGSVGAPTGGVFGRNGRRPA